MHPLPAGCHVAACIGIVLGSFVITCAAQQRTVPPRPAPISQTPAQLVEQVAELRMFLTSDPAVVIGEIAITGTTQLTTLSVGLEQGTVVFVDSGVTPDRRARDGVFTARFRQDTTAAFREYQRQLDASTRALTSGTAWITRGPRDTVTATKALQELRAAGIAGFDNLAARTSAVVSASTPMAAARALGVDPTVTAFITKSTTRSHPAALSPDRVLGVPFFSRVPLPSVPIDEFKSLMVIHPSVLEDPTRSYDACTSTGTPGGVWSFGHLMRELSEGTGLTPEDYLLQWLGTWQAPQVVNTFSVFDAPRAVSMQSLIADWQALSGATLNVDYFPARLLAIVNRPDLADKIGYSVGGSAGEARFVFGIGRINFQGNCEVGEFTVIFEYAIQGGSCSAVKAWHQRWKNLDQYGLGSGAYRAALAAITQDVTESGVQPGQLPNQSALSQLRTNDGMLVGKWQLREYRLRAANDPAGPGTLGLSTVKQTPDAQFRQSSVLSAYLLANESDILKDQHVVPETFPTAAEPFLGAHIKLLEPEAGSTWFTNLSGLANPSETRRKFSLATCDACHNAETQTIFTHIGFHGGRPMGSAPQLSKFLTGTPPMNGHVYNDLKERRQRMSNILSASCFDLAAVKMLPMAH